MRASSPQTSRALPALHTDVALGRRERQLKRLEDCVLGGLLALVAAPAMLVIAMALRLASPGPVLFRQERVTEGGRLFRMVKFRTLPCGMEHERRGGPIETHRLGRWLRQTGLDELPQLLNVLRGEMSLVGPRPERPEFAAVLSRELPEFDERTRVRAGITGLAQIAGLRGATDLEARLALDLHYIRSWSPRLDMQILARTLVASFRHTLPDRSHPPDLEARVLGRGTGERE